MDDTPRRRASINAWFEGWQTSLNGVTSRQESDYKVQFYINVYPTHANHGPEEKHNPSDFRGKMIASNPEMGVGDNIQPYGILFPQIEHGSRIDAGSPPPISIAQLNNCAIITSKPGFKSAWMNG